MNGAALGRKIAEVIAAMVASCSREVDEAIGSFSSGTTDINFALYLCWTAFARITTDTSISEEDAEITVGAMEAKLGELFFLAGGARGGFAALLKNRYQGYLNALEVPEKHGGPICGTANYFIACCRCGEREVEFGKLIPDVDHMDGLGLGHLVNPEARVLFKDLKAKGWSTYPVGMETLQVSNLLAADAAGLLSGIDALMEQHS